MLTLFILLLGFICWKSFKFSFKILFPLIIGLLLVGLTFKLILFFTPILLLILLLLLFTRHNV